MDRRQRRKARTPGAPQTLPDALAAIGTATATDPVLIDAATDATVAAAGASATATRAANTAIAIDLVAFGPGSAGAAGEAEGTVAPASAVALAAPTDSSREDALAALAQRAATDPAGAATDTGKVGTAAAPSTDRGSDTSAAAHSAAGATQSTASRQATGDRADMAFRMLLETTAFEVTTDTTPADDFRALAPQPPRQTPPATRADLAADLLDRVRNEQAASQHAGEGATDDPAVTIARSTATRDTAGTALAAALLAGDVDARKPAIKAAAGGHAQGAAATAASSDGDTTAATQPADAGKAPTPPPAPAGGIAAAASSFAARIKAAAAERGDTVTTATMAPSANGAGAGGTAAPTAGTASASLAQSFAATLGAGVGGQAGGSAGVSTAMAQIAAEISRRAAAGATRFQIRLDPAELGRVDVRLSLDDKGAARAVLSVERKDTFDLITRDHRALERTLREAGYEVRDGSVQVSLKQNEGNGSGNANSGGNNAFERFAQQQGQQGQGQRGSARAFPEQAAELAPDADTLSRTPTFLTRPAASGRVDIRI